MKSGRTILALAGLLLGLLMLPASVHAQFVIPDGTTNIVWGVYNGRTDLTNVIIPDSVTNIGDMAFRTCTNLTKVTVGQSVITIGPGAFSCMDPGPFGSGGVLPKQVSIYFTGNAPRTVDTNAFDTLVSMPSSPSFWDTNENTIVFYNQGTTGWGPTLAGRRAVCLTPNWSVQVSEFQVLHGFITPLTFCRFTLTSPMGTPVLVEACTNLTNPAWLPATNNCWILDTSLGRAFPVQQGIFTMTSGQVLLDETVCPNWDWPDKCPMRFYRVRPPWP